MFNSVVPLKKGAIKVKSPDSGITPGLFVYDQGEIFLFAFPLAESITFRSFLSDLAGHEGERFQVSVGTGSDFYVVARKAQIYIVPRDSVTGPQTWVAPDRMALVYFRNATPEVLARDAVVIIDADNAVELTAAIKSAI